MKADSKIAKMLVCVAGATVGLAVSAAPLAKDGKATASVDTNKSGDKTIAYAAQELTNWVFKISGAALPVDGAAEGTKIVLGTPETSSAAKAFAAKHAEDFKKLDGNDGFIIAEEGGFLGFGGKTVFIVGSIPRGVRNGVYRFLERNSDIIWVRELQSEDGFGTVYSKDANLKNGIDYLVDVPVLTGRSWTGHGEGQKRYQQRLLNNDILGRKGDVNFPTSLLMDKYGKTDPDVFPLVDGKRQIWHDCQLCYMNPKTLDLMEKEGLAYLKKQKIDNPTSVAVNLGDNWSVCECELCKKPIKGDDGQLVQPTAKNFRSTQFAYFNMELWKRFRKHYPNLRPCLAPAYIWTAEPSAIRYPDGGSVYCPYVKNHKKPVYDDVANAEWHSKAERFKKAGMGFTGLYEYYLCTTTPDFYHATMDVMQKDLNYYLPELKSCYLDAPYGDGALTKPEENEKGRGGYGISNLSYDVSAIEFWVCSRLMWNPATDVKEARREFCRRAYHGAADIMIGYYEKLADNYNNDPAGCFWNDDPVNAAKHYIVEKGLVDWVKATLDKALAAATDPRSKELIRRHQWRMMQQIDKAVKAPKKVFLDVGADWTVMDPITRPAKPNEPSKDVKAWARNDNKAVELKFEIRNKKWRAAYDKLKAEGKVGTQQDATTPFDWCTCVEVYFDGDLASGGSFYQLAFSLDERTYAGGGCTKKDGAKQWKVKIDPVGDDGLVAVARIPFDFIGVEISKNNKLGCQFIGCNSSWNGGQWNAPTSFQVLKLGMR